MRVSWLCLALVLPSCKFDRPADVPDNVDAADLDADVDGSPIDGPDVPVDADTRRWSTPSLLAFNNTDDQRSPHVSPNGLEIFFEAPRYDKKGIDNIWYSTRPSTSADWGTGSIYVQEIDDAADAERDPYISSTGLELYFVREGVIHVTKRASLASPFQAPVSTGWVGTEPVLANDDLTIYYLDPSASCPGETCRTRRRRNSLTSGWGPAMVEEFTGAAYRHVQVSNDGLRALLADTLVDGSGAHVAIARRPSIDSPWEPPEPVMEFFGMSAIDDARWTWDETEMYLSIVNGARRLDIYVSRLEP